MRRLNSSSTRQNRNLENLLQISNLLFQFFIKAAHNSYILCSSLATIMSTFVTLSYIKSIRRLMTKIRNKDTPPVEFRHYARKLMLILSEECLAYVQRKDVDVITPTGSVYAGYEILNESNIVAVSIIRAGDSLLDAFMEVCPSAQVGKVLIQRNEETAEPILFYTKLPPLTGKYVILLDPMLGK